MAACISKANHNFTPLGAKTEAATQQGTFKGRRQSKVTLSRPKVDKGKGIPRKPLAPFSVTHLTNETYQKHGSCISKVFYLFAGDKRLQITSHVNGTTYGKRIKPFDHITRETFQK
jgi:hypothetical protein